MKRIYWILIIAILVVGVFVWRSSSNEPQKLAVNEYDKNAQITYDEDQAQVYFDEMLPLVEKETGKKFKNYRS